MNRGDLSKLTKEQLINTLLNPAVGVIKAGPVFKPKSLTQLAAEKFKHSIRRPAVQPKPSGKMPTLKTLAANAMVKDKIKYFENLSDKQPATIRLDKKPVSLQPMRDIELEHTRVSKYIKDSSFQNLFHRLQQMPGKREKVQITINAKIEHTVGKRIEFKDKSYGPFEIEIPIKFGILAKTRRVSKNIHTKSYQTNYKNMQQVFLRCQHMS